MSYKYLEINHTTLESLKDFKLPPEVGFGSIIAPVMITCDYKNGEWGKMEMVPYGPIELSPVAKVLHYAQEIFEGLKSALGKGENLELAMITFYNAGYKKEEIEEAAKALQIQKFKQIQPTQPVQPPSAQPILTQPPQIQPTPIKQTMPEKQGAGWPHLRS